MSWTEEARGSKAQPGDLVTVVVLGSKEARSKAGRPYKQLLIEDDPAGRGWVLLSADLAVVLDALGIEEGDRVSVVVLDDGLHVLGHAEAE